MALADTLAVGLDTCYNCQLVSLVAKSELSRVFCVQAPCPSLALSPTTFTTAAKGLWLLFCV